MTSDERKTLEALADDARHLLTTTIEERAAIRSALAEVDALTQQVATLTAESADLNAENDMLNARVITGAQQVQDLDARAIPADMLTQVAIDHGPSAATIGYVAGDPDPATRWQCWTPTQRSGHPTLSAALRAATEA